MRFPVMFRRWKGGAQPADIPILLGGDAVPTNAAPLSPKNDDNLMVFKFSNNNGWPVHRIVVGYHPPSGSLALAADAYFWDGTSERWYKINTAGAVSLPADGIAIFDCPVLSDMPNTLDGITSPTLGGVEFMLVVSDPGAAPNGAHVFVMAPDLTTF